MNEREYLEPVECHDYNAYLEHHQRLQALYTCGLMSHDEMMDIKNRIELDKQLIFGGSNG